MKKLIVMAIAILVTGCITAFANDTHPRTAPQGLDYRMAFTKIIVSDDIDLQLEESSDRNIKVTGNQADIENVEWKIKGNVLFVKSRTGSLKNKVKVSVTVSELKEISIRGQSVITSAGALHSPSLYLFLEDDCRVSIKNAGMIYIVKKPGTEVDIEKLVGDVRIGR